MKYKMNENGGIVCSENGHPIVIKDDGTETELRATEIVTTKIPSLNAEAKQYREKKEALEKQLNELTGKLGDLNVDEARKALSTVKGLKEKKLIDAQEADSARTEIEVALKTQMENLQRDYENKTRTFEDTISGLQNQVYDLKVSDKFNGSPSLKDTIFEPLPDLAKKYFGENFKVEEGKVIGYSNGTQILTSNPNRFGEPADFDEALKTMIENHPNKGTFRLAGAGAGGNGAPNKDGMGGGTIKVSRDDLRNPYKYDKIQKQATESGVEIEVMD